jgi:hypothetical protein
VAQGPQLHQIAVGQGANARNRRRQENLLPVIDDFEAGQRQEVAQILQCQPVLLQLGTRQAQCRSELQRRFPQVAVAVQNDACFRITEVPYFIQYRLNVKHIVQQV